MGRYQEANKYNSTPRKVFDKYVDRMDLKLLRAKEDHRSDIGTLIRKLKELDNKLFLLQEQIEGLVDHVDRHCVQLDRDRSTEGLE